MIFKKSNQVLLSIFIFILFSNNFVKAETELCSAPKFDNNNLSQHTHLRVINQDTLLYQNFDDTQSIRKLNFNDLFAIYTGNDQNFEFNKNNRIAVKSYTNSNDLIGWITRGDLLCGNQARINPDNGLESRIFIKANVKEFIDKDNKDRLSTITVSQRNDQSSYCRIEKCRELTRFDRYFVYAKKEHKNCKNQKEEQQQEQCYSYLLADKEKLESSDVLVGWVNNNQVFEWNNAYGLRISEALALPTKSNNNPEMTQKKLNSSNSSAEPNYICGYRTKEEALEDNPKNCYIKLHGGWIWYEYPHRMYLKEFSQESNPKIYKVTAPVTTDRTLATETLFNSNLSNLRRLDIMFLIDGTNSMAPSMKDVKKTMESIIDKLPKDIQYRFAFQIYRDKYAQDKEFGDYYPFSQSCDANDDNIKINKQKFVKKLNDAVKVTESDINSDDDHFENLYGGIKKAAKQLRKSCPEHMKILFVLGDAGYSPTAQLDKHKRETIDTNVINQLLTGNSSQDTSYKSDNLGIHTKPIISFFIQTENKKPNSPDYDKAYQKFTEQANYFINQLRESMQSRFEKLGIEYNDNEYILTINSDISKSITQTIKSYARPNLLSEFDSRVRGGEAPVDALKSLIGDPAYGNIPGLYIDQIAASECKTIKDCKTPRKDLVADFYIKESPYVIEDIWMLKNDYEQLTADLNNAMTIIQDTKKGSAKNKLIEVALTKSIETRLRQYGSKLTDDDKNKYTMAEIYREKLNTAMPIDSPLFNLKIGEVKDLDNCVIDKLFDWIYDHKEIMKKLTDFNKALPICGTSTISDEDQVKAGKEAIKHFPPKCGRSDAELAEARNKLLTQCEISSEREYLFKNLINITTPYSVFSFPSDNMSVYHNLGSYQSNEDKTKNSMWIPRGILP